MSEGGHRKRVSHACERCRLKKTKCDGTTPVCGRCVADGEVCVYVDRHKSRERLAPTTAYVDLLEGKVSVLQDALLTLASRQGISLRDSLSKAEQTNMVLSHLGAAPLATDEEDSVLALASAATASDSPSDDETSLTSSSAASTDGPHGLKRVRSAADGHSSVPHTPPHTPPQLGALGGGDGRSDDKPYWQARWQDDDDTDDNDLLMGFDEGLNGFASINTSTMDRRQRQKESLVAAALEAGPEAAASQPFPTLAIDSLTGMLSEYNDLRALYL